MKFKLNAKFKPSIGQEKAISTLTFNAKAGMEKQMMLGVTGSGKTFVMANMIERLQKPTLILSHNKTLAAQLYEEFKEFFPENAVKYFVSYYDYYQPEAYLPGKDVFIEKESDINKEIERFRLSAMNSALTRDDLIVIASVSCIYNIGNPKDYKKRSFEIKVGDSIVLSELSRTLVQMQYQRDLTDFVHGSFRIKGDVVDIYMPYSDNPIRLDFFGDELERITYIDALTGYTLSEINEVEIFPAKAFIFDKERIKKASLEIEEDLRIRIKEYKNSNRELEAQRIEQRTRYDLEMLAEVGYCKGMENYSRYFEDREPGEPPYTLMDYFPKKSLLFVDESHITIPQVGGMSGGDRARKQTLIDYGFRLPSARDNRPLNFEEFRERQRQTVYFSATPKEWEIEDSNGTVIELLTRPTGLLDPEIEIRPTEYQIDNVVEEVKKNTANGERVLITTLTKRMAEDLSSYLDENGIKVHYLHSDQDTVERVEVLRSLRLGEYDVVVGINLLREGLDLPEVSLILILDADKEGFLRSKTSLVQTVGRAARHINGRVIMYADKITDSMQYTLNETARRRKLQLAYNKKHNITPTGIQKDIRDQLVKKEDENEIEYKKWIEKTQPPISEIKRIIKDLNDKMLMASENLQFEKAAETRDKIKELKSLL